MDRIVRIGVVGSSLDSTDKVILNKALEVGCLIAESKAILVCGGLGGVMEFAAKGAKQTGGLTIGIIPGESINDANPYIDVPIATGIGEARNIIVVRNSDALIAIGGMFGTLSEIAFALKSEKPVIGLDTWELNKSEGKISGIIPANTPKEAVEKALEAINAR